MLDFLSGEFLKTKGRQGTALGRQSGYWSITG